MAVLLAACSSGKRDSRVDTDSVEPVPTEFHADNDIAMTVSSIADAIRVGEALDTALYNFDGVLTDGQGRPLYSNLQGMPGEWDVDVISPTQAELRNRDVGDLLPDDLEEYLAAALNMSSVNVVHEYHDDDDDFKTVIYDFQGGYLRIETRKQVASNGLEGSLMRIIASKDLPSFN